MGIFGFGKKKKDADNEKEMMVRICSHAGNVINMLKTVLTGKNGLDLYLVTLYAAGLAGIACHEAVKANGEAFSEISCANGKKYYMGEALNKYLYENEYSVASFVCAITQMQPSDVLEIVKKQASTIGSDEFVVASDIDAADLYKKVKECWDGIKDNMTTQYCKKPEEWPILYGIVLQNILKEAIKYTQKDIAFETAVDVACALSKMDKESL